MDSNIPRGPWRKREGHLASKGGHYRQKPSTDNGPCHPGKQKLWLYEIKSINHSEERSAMICDILEQMRKLSYTFKILGRKVKQTHLWMDTTSQGIPGRQLKINLVSLSLHWQVLDVKRVSDSRMKMKLSMAGGRGKEVIHTNSAQERMTSH